MYSNWKVKTKRELIEAVFHKNVSGFLLTIIKRYKEMELKMKAFGFISCSLNLSFLAI